MGDLMLILLMFELCIDELCGDKEAFLLFFYAIAHSMMLRILVTV